MRNFIITSFAIITTIFSSLASAADVDVKVSNRHMFRGNPVGETVGIQPSLTIPSAENNLGETSFNIWGHLPIIGTFSEIDLTLTQELGEVGVLNVTTQYYDGSFVELDSHDIEVGFSTNFGGVDLSLNRIALSDTIEGDTYVELGYGFGDYDLFVGVGDGAYSESGDFEAVNVGFTYNIPEPTKRGRRAASWMRGYETSFIYNPSTETPYFVVSKSW